MSPLHSQQQKNTMEVLVKIWLISDLVPDLSCLAATNAIPSRCVWPVLNYRPVYWEKPAHADAAWA